MAPQVGSNSNCYTCIGMNYFLNQIEISQEGTLCNLFTASNKELGFKGETKLKDTHARILEIGGVLLPAEVAPQIVIQCGDKVDVDVGLTLAMESIVNQVYDPSLFVMKRYDHDPLLYLMISHGYPGTLWDANTRFVFGRQE